MTKTEQVLLERSYRTIIEDYTIMVCEQHANTILLEKKLETIKQKKSTNSRYEENEPLIKIEGALISQLNNCRISALAYQNNVNMFKDKAKNLLGGE